MDAILNQALDLVTVLLAFALIFGPLAYAADWLERRFGP